MDDFKGFTLLELMVTVGIATILLCVAIPEFQGWIDSQRLSASVRAIHTLLQESRGTAIKEGRNVVVAFGAGAGTSGTYVAFVDKDDDRIVDPGEETLAAGHLPASVTMVSARFDSGGVGTTQRAWTFFDTRGLATGRNGVVALKNGDGKGARVILTSAGASRVEIM